MKNHAGTCARRSSGAIHHEHASISFPGKKQNTKGQKGKIIKTSMDVRSWWRSQTRSARPHHMTTRPTVFRASFRDYATAYTSSRPLLPHPFRPPPNKNQKPTTSCTTPSVQSSYFNFQSFFVCHIFEIAIKQTVECFFFLSVFGCLCVVFFPFPMILILWISRDQY